MVRPQTWWLRSGRCRVTRSDVMTVQHSIGNADYAPAWDLMRRGAGHAARLRPAADSPKAALWGGLGTPGHLWARGT